MAIPCSLVNYDAAGDGFMGIHGTSWTLWVVAMLKELGKPWHWIG